jgi:hypothetical protein
MIDPTPIDDLPGLDSYDRTLASDMDSNRPIYADPPPPTDRADASDSPNSAA